MYEGLYAIRFKTELGQGSGVIVLEGGRIRGGDSMMVYTGRYSFNGPMFSADMVIRKHSDFPGLRSLFNQEDFSLALHGNFSKDPPDIIAVSPNVAGVEMRATVIRLAE